MRPAELHPEVWAALQRWRARLPQALLVTGAPGIGKFDLMRAFVADLFCESPLPEGQGCGHCEGCHWFSLGNHPDFRVLVPKAMEEVLGLAREADEESDAKASQKKPSKEIVIDQVRGLEGLLSVGSYRHGMRVALIYPAEDMNRNTANALLKSLEEPPPNTLFCLVSGNPAQLLPTIRSRCQHLPIPMPTPARSLAFLRAQGISDEREAQRYLALAGGAPKLAVTLADKNTFPWLSMLLEQLGRGRQMDPLAAAGELDTLIRSVKEVAALQPCVMWVQKWVSDLALVSQGYTPRYFVSEQSALDNLSKEVPLRGLLTYYRKILLPLQQEAAQPLNVRLFLESLLLGYRKLFI